MEKWLVLVVMMIGLAMYLAPLDKAPKLSEVGRLMFAIGMFVLLWPYQHRLP